MGEENEPEFCGLWGKGDQKQVAERCEHSLLYHHLGSDNNQKPEYNVRS